jgi:pimeloyl-ACP methyl ester carboxylesterase
VTEIVHETVNLGEVRLHVARAGQGPLMLFLHGFPEFWRAWQAQLAEFGQDHLAVAPDQRGYNLSDKPADLAAYRADRLIADIGKLADYYAKGKRFTLVAHDWGGAIAWGFAIAHPDRLDRLVIINAPHPGRFIEALRTDTGQQAASQYMRFFRDAGAEAALSADNFKALWDRTFQALYEKGVVDDAFKAEYLAAWGQPGALTGGLNWYRATPLRPPNPAGGDGPPELDVEAFRVKVPTLVIWGEQDRALLPVLLEGLDRFVDDLTVRRLPEVDHWVTHQASAQVNAWIRDFLGR